MFHRTHLHSPEFSPTYLGPPRQSELRFSPLLRTAGEMAFPEIVKIAVSVDTKEVPEMPKLDVSVQAA